MIMEEGLQFRFNFAVQQQEAQLSPVTQKDEKRQDASAITTKQWILPPPPLSVEVFPAKIANFRPFVSETVVLKEGLTLLKGRVISTNLFEIANTDLVPGKYEGGLKLWECTIDLVETLNGEIKDGQLSFEGKHVLELGCGHGLPGILACIKGASSVHFQDFNAEVLRNLTIHNVNANLEKAKSQLAKLNSDGDTANNKRISIAPDLHYYAGDWGEVHTLLSVAQSSASPQMDPMKNGGLENFSCTHGSDLLTTQQDEQDVHNNDKSNTASGNSSDSSTSSDTKRLSSSCTCERGPDRKSRAPTRQGKGGGYDIILMSETVYSMASLPKLYELIKKCLQPPHGVVYCAGKKHYFGVGGGTRQFKHLIEEDGVMEAHLVADFADGSSNVREIWKFFFRVPGTLHSRGEAI
ncbi:hypothetical protein CY35_05G029600 [Sphagnum magellanicum]|nr:hypothetical protein CY35_05G029600 [Sphagnum magellanicum]